MERKIYKLAINFGFIYERKDRDKNNAIKITYGYIIPRESMTERRAPLLIKSQQDIELYKEYVQSVIISVQEKTLIDTKQKYIAVYSVCLMTYILPISGKPIPSLKIHLSKKRQCLRYVNSPYPNTCVLEAIARHLLKDTKEKRYSDSQVLHKMKEIGALFYKDFNPKTFEGFNYATDIQKIHEHLKLSVNLFSYEQDDKTFHYFLSQSFPIPTSLSATELLEGDDELNLLLIQSEEINGINIHTLLVTDKQRLTGLLFCPICKNHCFKQDTNTAKEMERHIKKCKGKIVKQVHLDDQQRPFIPHIMCNKTYRYLLAQGRQNEFKPTQYFITYDFETYEHKVNTNFGKESKVISQLVPLSVASTIHSSKGIKSIYYDICTGMLKCWAINNKTHQRKEM
ncbi:MAG: hypothetical protein EZS28_007629 [Streblomastix strix]|uniref:Uncharacterized protein n=1 Tax=Streblomastix strix TaxID=222440 RepID=A0A5J4WPC6_9EUKA|nr:MAG: hypothetical protein EZS28_007629 [Streblomastix strix]